MTVFSFTYNLQLTTYNLQLKTRKPALGIVAEILLWYIVIFSYYIEESPFPQKIVADSPTEGNAQTNFYVKYDLNEIYYN